ncbi:hypothetical protein TNCV_2037441 [Trichonephila clavipes]|nr:hypothetical protein TNCV_2037441 [Trichonephila clavipes]
MRPYLYPGCGFAWKKTKIRLRELNHLFLRGSLQRKRMLKITPSCCLSEKGLNNQSVRRHLGCFYPWSNHWEVGGRPQCDKCGCRVWNCSQHVHDFGTISNYRTAIRGSVVVVHEEPHPQMTGTLSYRSEETKRQTAEKSLDTHTGDWTTRVAFTVARRLHGGGLFARRPVRCTFNACPTEKRRYGSTVPFHGRQCTMSSHSSCRTALRVRILNVWIGRRSPDLNPIEHVLDFRQTLGSSYLPPVTIRVSIALQDVMGSNASTTH